MVEQLPLPARERAQAYVAAADERRPGLIGALYLVGSVAMDDFQPEVSDVDFIALTEHRVTEHDLAELKWVHTRVAESGHPVFEGQWSRGVASCGERCRSSKVRY
jgi:predicted nucleotidyltransferase